MIPVLVDFLKKWLEANGGYKYAGEWIIDAVAGVPRLPLIRQKHCAIRPRVPAGLGFR